MQVDYSTSTLLVVSFYALSNSILFDKNHNFNEGLKITTKFSKIFAYFRVFSTDNI